MELIISALLSFSFLILSSETAALISASESSLDFSVVGAATPAFAATSDVVAVSGLAATSGLAVVSGLASTSTAAALSLVAPEFG